MKRADFSRNGVGQRGAHKPNLIGWCDTPNGFMMVFECPDCFEKYRFHGNTGNLFNIDDFDYIAGNYAEGGMVANGAELWAKYEKYCEEE